MFKPDRDLSKSMESVRDWTDFSHAIRNFLDRFKARPTMAWLAEEPKLMDLNNEGLANAYLGADADYLPCAHGIPCPAWASTAERVKKTSWSAAKSPNLKATLVQESPAAFRVRNLFVSANALHRA